ncbi:MAG: hypothetical protein MK102_12355 [Fuerstiella sp.]|nr:hypothetical protein [Fuerstiella sp.]
MIARIAAAFLVMAVFTSSASAGHHYYYPYPAYTDAYVYPAPVYVAPVHVAPVIVHHPAYLVPAPVYYRPAPVYYRSMRHSFFSHGYRPFRGEVEIDVDFGRHGYEIEIDYDD